jgi:hypothetical protein
MIKYQTIIESGFGKYNVYNDTIETTAEEEALIRNITPEEIKENLRKRLVGVDNPDYCGSSNFMDYKIGNLDISFSVRDKFHSLRGWNQLGPMTETEFDKIFSGWMNVRLYYKKSYVYEGSLKNPIETIIQDLKDALA